MLGKYPCDKCKRGKKEARSLCEAVVPELDENNVCSWYDKIEEVEIEE